MSKFLSNAFCWFAISLGIVLFVYLGVSFIKWDLSAFGWGEFRVLVVASSLYSLYLVTKNPMP